MKDHRGTDLVARSHLVTRQARVLETAIMKPFHDSHPPNSPFLDCCIAILWPTCSWYLRSNCVIGVLVWAPLLWREAWMPFVTVSPQLTPHTTGAPGAMLCPFRPLPPSEKCNDNVILRVTLSNAQMLTEVYPVLFGSHPGQN